jgi:aminomuconate-semialdehyde/2-hydroxymuconate-6-semialdehyde dehydrogenase
MDTGHHAYTRFEPAGVVAAVAPWNFPLMLESWKVAPALAWGNTVVLKPAEDTPASAAIMARLALEAGLPPGVLNVLHGYGPNSAGATLTEHPAVDRITFTGESATGRVIARAAAANLVPVSLELGGKGANIVFDDAALDNAVDWSVKAIFSNAGQVCLAGSRLYVQRGSYEESLVRFAAAAEALVVGDPKDPATQLGPLAAQEHWKKVRSFLDSIEPDGGTIRTGGPGEGWVVLPTIVENAPPTARVCRASAALKAGTVWVNCFFIRDLRAPFGGVGDSGIGREGGNFSREFFTEPKAVVMQL